MRKLLRVNMAELSVKEEVLPSEKEPTGGRHLTSSIVASEVSATCHPLSAHNKLVVAPGWLAGTGAPCGGRLSIGAKSPLTGTIKESNSGGQGAGALSDPQRSQVPVSSCSIWPHWSCCSVFSLTPNIRRARKKA